MLNLVNTKEIVKIMKKSKIIVLCIASLIFISITALFIHKYQKNNVLNDQSISFEKTEPLEKEIDQKPTKEKSIVASEESKPLNHPDSSDLDISFAQLKDIYSSYSIDELQNELKHVDSEIDDGHYIEMANENTLSQEQRKYLGFLLKKRDAISIVKINKQLDKIKS